MIRTSQGSRVLAATPFKRAIVLLAGLFLCYRCGAVPQEITVSNAAISVTFHANDATFAVTDKRSGHIWRQKPLAEGRVTQSAKIEYGIELTWHDAGLGADVKAELVLDKNLPEFVLSLRSAAGLKRPLRFPNPFVTGPGTVARHPAEYLVVPMNEGISYPVEDETIDTRRLIAYGGHGICMAFWGVTDGQRGHMAIIETPDDAAIRIMRTDGKLCIAPEWDPQKGRFGYTRSLRYVFFDKGGHVAICKRYRSYAQKAGLLKRLLQKRNDNPNVDLLIGAVNVWCWESDAPAICRRMQQLGIERILWSNARPLEELVQLNRMGVLTSCYDTYRPVMDPANYPRLRNIHSCWVREAWPDDITITADGEPAKGWAVRDRDGKWCHTIEVCPKRAVSHARKRISKDLATHPYRCRFIDTTTAAPWRECHHPDHPLTRSESRFWKMQLLGLVCEEFGLVTGSETGHDAAVPFVHYFEGMLSLAPYRIPDAGRNMIRIWDEAPERVAKFQVGHKYRLPLWELVYHDCVVAQWYWGDYNNKLPALWDKRDLFNILYGTPPMFMFDRRIWEQNKERFAESYKNVCPVARAVGYAEMTDHRFLTPDSPGDSSRRDVQQTRFANGIAITVNFGDKPYRLPDGKTIGPMGYHVSGMSDGSK